MTLLLGALTANSVVLGADGIEFLHAPGKPKRQDILNCRKLWFSDSMPVVLGVHGQNRLIEVGSHLESQRLAIEMLSEILFDIAPTTTVRELCESIYERLAPDVDYTFQALAAASILTAPIGILVMGFDSDGGRARCYEAWWPLPHERDTSRILQHPQNGELPAVMHSGDGARFAKTAISHGGRYSVARLNKATASEIQQYIRTLYDKAESLQSHAAKEFGGHYHEVTVTADGARWTVDPSDVA